MKTTKTNKHASANANATRAALEDKAAEAFAALMVERIENLQTDWHQPWLSSIYNDPHNLQGASYNGINELILALLAQSKGYKYPIFGTFQSFISMNPKDKASAKDKDAEGAPRISVQKGQQGFPVVFYKKEYYTKDKYDKITPEQYAQRTAAEREFIKSRPVLRYYTVFNIDQTNLKEVAPSLYEEMVKPYEEREKDANAGTKKTQIFAPLMEIIEQQDWLCPIRLTNSNSAYFNNSIYKNERAIVLPMVSQFKSAQLFNATAFHEMAHSTTIMLNRESTGGSYGKEELVAELTAAVVCAHYGIDSTLAEHNASYLKSWLKEIKEDASFIKVVLKDVKKAYKVIVDAIENHKDAPQLADIPTTTITAPEPETEEAPETEETQEPATVTATPAPARNVQLSLF